MASSGISSEKTFKVVLLGDGGVGKTAFLHRAETGKFLESYVATHGAEVRELPFFTTAGPIKMQVWDTAGQETRGKLRRNYYVNADAAILFFDLTSKITYGNVPKWYSDIEAEVGPIPMVLVGNKYDEAKNRKVKAKNISFHRKKDNVNYYDVSALANYNFSRPFLDLSRRLLGDPRLEFLEVPTLQPPQMAINHEVEDDD